MMTDVAAKRAEFRALHAQGCFVLPNPWDIGSARLLQRMGFKALASTSSGFAWTIGRPDYGVTRDDVLAHLTLLCAATDLPVNADFQEGFAEAPEAVAANVTLAIGTGVAGLSIEDRKLGGGGLYDFDYAVARVRAARAAINRSGQDVILVARTEGLLGDSFPVTTAIDRLVAFAEAGADCLYAPGVTGKDNIAAMVRAVAPKPLNVLMAGPGMTVAQLADLGVRRISVGGALARVAWGAMLKAAYEISRGSFDGLGNAASGKILNGMFGQKPG
ncbi:MAG TPA: isocitrate lyase/phosphoenolpyruvate mutase family protein [Rhizomicrobium sp.]|nr:isocitrate lyase/phosphoenolpyruvate mutase family protein [Rhizomicrobium sp.]